MNWGNKLLIGMAIFMIFIVTMGYIAIYSKADALVDQDYYEKGIAYDVDYKKKEQVITDHAEPVIAVRDYAMVIKFTNTVLGNAQFQRPDNKNLDQTMPFKSGNNEVILPLSGLAKGRWHLILDWTSAGKSYLYNKEIFLP